MTNFRDKDNGRYVEAWQFDGSYGCMAEVIEENPGVYWHRGAIRVRTPEGNHIVWPYDWVIRADNALETCGSDDFAQNYESTEVKPKAKVK